MTLKPQLVGNTWPPLVETLTKAELLLRVHAVSILMVQKTTVVLGIFPNVIKRSKKAILKRVPPVPAVRKRAPAHVASIPVLLPLPIVALGPIGQALVWIILQTPRCLQKGVARRNLNPARQLLVQLAAYSVVQQLPRNS